MSSILKIIVVEIRRVIAVNGLFYTRNFVSSHQVIHSVIFSLNFFKNYEVNGRSVFSKEKDTSPNPCPRETRTKKFLNTRPSKK